MDDMNFISELLGMLTPEQLKEVKAKAAVRAKEVAGRMTPEEKHKVLKEIFHQVMLDKIVDAACEILTFAETSEKAGLIDDYAEAFEMCAEFLWFACRTALVARKYNLDPNPDDPKFVEAYAREYHKNVKEEFECI